MELPASGHEPVLLREILSWLDPRPGQSIVDCTLGRAGHASAIAQRILPGGVLIGLDADPRNLQFSGERLKAIGGSTRLFHANFAELADVLGEVGVEQVDAILADLGISTNQLFDEQYGLSFAAPMALDMRLDPRLRRSAAHLVNNLPEEELA